MEGRGLGHLSRSCKLARSLQDFASCMIGTGIRYAGNLVPEKCEYVRIPGLDGLIESRAAERGKIPFVDIPERDALRFRRGFLETLEKAFNPDLIVTDLLPAGNFDELAGILASSPAQKFILFRSVVGNEGTEAIHKFGLDKLASSYDGFLIASDARTSHVEEDLQLKNGLAAKSHYIGYVSLPVSRGEIESVRLQRGLRENDRWVVCSAGSGFHSAPEFGDWLHLAEEFRDVHFDIVLGPSYWGCAPSANPSVFFDGRVRLLTEHPDLRLFHAAADVVISHGGYNALTETMEGGAPLIVDVRNDPHQERVRHARELQRYYPITITESPEQLRTSLCVALSNSSPRRPVRNGSALDFNGCDEFRRLISERLATSRAASRPSPGPSEAQTTVFVTTVGDQQHFTPCMEHLRSQTVARPVDVIDRVAPMSAALQQMIDRCNTPFYVQVDEDMQLFPSAIESLERMMQESPPSVALICAYLWDCETHQPIQGVKIYRHSILKQFPYRDTLSCEIEQIARMKEAGFSVSILPLGDRSTCFGTHGGHYTPATAFKRWQRHFQKHQKLGNMKWLEPWPKRLLDRYFETRDEVHLYAFLGAVAGITGDAPPDRELDWTHPNTALASLRRYFASHSNGTVITPTAARTDNCHEIP